MLGKLIILNTIGAGLLVAGYALGYLQVLWAADKMWAIPIIGTLTLLGMLDVCLNRITAALWLSDKLPVVGLALTVIGLLWAANGDIGGDGFKRDVLHALVGNLMGVVGYAWIELNARVCR